MGTIQSSVNQAMATVMGGIVGMKHVSAQKEQIALEKEKKAIEREEDVKKAERNMTEVALEASGKFNQENAKKFALADYLGLKPNQGDEALWAEAQAIKAEKVLKSETYSKLMQDDRLLNRFASVTSTQEGRELLRNTVVGGNL